MLNVVINIEGKTLADIEYAIDEAKKHISNGNRSGLDSNDDGSYDFEVTGEESKKVFDVTYYDKHGEVIESTQIDEENEDLAWDLFKEFGHKKKKGMYVEFEEGTED